MAKKVELSLVILSQQLSHFATAEGKFHNKPLIDKRANNLIDLPFIAAVLSLDLLGLIPVARRYDVYPALGSLGVSSI